MFPHVMLETEENIKNTNKFNEKDLQCQKTATCAPLTHFLRPHFTIFQLFVQLFQTSHKKFHNVLSVASSILVMCMLFVRLSPVWTYKVNKMSISGRCKVCHLSITGHSQDLRLKPTSVFYTTKCFIHTAEEIVFVNLTYQFVKTQSDQRSSCKSYRNPHPRP